MVTIPLGTSDFRRSVSRAPFLRVRNRYFEQNPANMKEQAALIARPALKRWLTVGDGPNRGQYSQSGSFDDAMFVLSGRELYRIDTDLNVTLLGGGFFDENDTFFRAKMTATAALGTVPEYLYIADATTLKVYEPDTYARGELECPTAPANNEEVRIGSVYYRFTNGSVNAGTPAGSSAHPWLVALGANSRASLENLADAINATGTAGTTYSTGLVVNASAEATGSNQNSLFAQARVIGAGGNSVVTTTTITGATWTAGTLTGGVTAGVSIVDVPEGLRVISVAFIAGYVIVVPAPKQGYKGRWYWIEPGEKFIRPENFATAERNPDPLVDALVLADQVALMGSKSVEVWFPSGNFELPFERSQSLVLENGLWEGSAAVVNNTLIFMDTVGTVYKLSGEGVAAISDPSVEERTRAAIKKAVTQIGPPPPVDSALAVTLSSAGQATAGEITSQTFAANLATATGGVGPYSYRWFYSSTNNLGNFGFVGINTTPLIVPQVVSVNNDTTATATLNCEVTDAEGTRALAFPAATYSHNNTLPVGAPPPVLPTLNVAVSQTVFTSAGVNVSGNTFPVVTATASGGTPPYTYSWYFDALFEGTWTATNSTTPSTTVAVTGVEFGLVATAQIRCRVVDSTGAVGTSLPVYYSHQNQEFIPPGGVIP